MCPAGGNPLLRPKQPRASMNTATLKPPRCQPIRVFLLRPSNGSGSPAALRVRSGRVESRADVTPECERTPTVPPMLNRARLPHSIAPPAIRRGLNVNNNARGAVRCSRMLCRPSRTAPHQPASARARTPEEVEPDRRAAPFGKGRPLAEAARMIGAAWSLLLRLLGLRSNGSNARGRGNDYGRWLKPRDSRHAEPLQITQTRKEVFVFLVGITTIRPRNCGYPTASWYRRSPS